MRRREFRAPMSRTVPGMVALFALLAFTATAGLATQRLQSAIPGSVTLSPGAAVEFRPTVEPLVGRNVVVTNNSAATLTVALSADGVLTVSAPPGVTPRIDESLGAAPSCRATAGANVIECSGVFSPAGQFISLSATGASTPTPTPAAGATEPVPLPTGCSNVTLTWPSGTPIATVAAAIAPASALLSIFRYDNARGQFAGFAPNAPAAANDYTAVGQRIEPVFICTTAPATLNRPVA